MSKKYSVLFVCLGNICRSPLAEGIFTKLVEERNLSDLFYIDSAGTGDWHIGNPPHSETTKVAKNNGILIDSYQARQVEAVDFDVFDLVVALDTSNYQDLLSIYNDEDCEIIHLRKFDSEKGDLSVPDPFYGGPQGHIDVYDMIHRCCVNLLDDLEKKLS